MSHILKEGVGLLQDKLKKRTMLCPHCKKFQTIRFDLNHESECEFWICEQKCEGDKIFCKTHTKNFK